MSYNFINLDYLDEVALGSNEFKVEIIETFLQKTPDSLSQMKKSLASSDYEQVGRVAHKLKTSFSFVGMQNMVELSKLIQNMGLNNEQTNQLPEKVNQLEEGFNRSKSELEQEVLKLKNQI